MSPARPSVQAIAFKPVYSFIRHVVELLDPILDELYYRFDLWSRAPTFDAEGTRTDSGEADFAKVREFWLLVAVAMAYLATVAGVLFLGLKIPQGVLIYFPGLLVAAAFGERVLISFNKAWASRGSHPEDAALAGLGDPGSRVE